jgi:hypothetical protein
MSGADRPASLPPAPVLPAAPDGYRPDIDGLRAIAVLAVVAYHVDAGLLPGGFVGVDAFLVVSGLLVTRQLLATAPSGIGGYARFLAGRIRRLAPTLLLVLAATLVAAQLLLRREPVLLAVRTPGLLRPGECRVAAAAPVVAGLGGTVLPALAAAAGARHALG